MTDLLLDPFVPPLAGEQLMKVPRDIVVRRGSLEVRQQEVEEPVDEPGVHFRVSRRRTEPGGAPWLLQGRGYCVWCDFSAIYSGGQPAVKLLARRVELHHPVWRIGGVRRRLARGDFQWRAQL